MCLWVCLCMCLWVCARVGVHETLNQQTLRLTLVSRPLYVGGQEENVGRLCRWSVGGYVGGR